MISLFHGLTDLDWAALIPPPKEAFPDLADEETSILSISFNQAFTQLGPTSSRFLAANYSEKLEPTLTNPALVTRSAA